MPVDGVAMALRCLERPEVLRQTRAVMRDADPLHHQKRRCSAPLARTVVLLWCVVTMAAPAPAAGPSTEVAPLDERVVRAYERGILWGLRRAPEISVEELLELREREALVLVDARSDAERSVSVIPGAVPLADLDDAIADGEDATVVVYCTVGARSARTTRELREEGVDARNLVGGVLAWAHAGLEFVHDGRPTRRVHVYGRSWDLLPPGYVSVW